ncbi:MAG: tetratricopeptide repeat protein [Candidatus Schekmanbacteria bacterium]|nr:tetratricopeptide repeat protein [Candidatus Schekmanbacteria bacterium]
MTAITRSSHGDPAFRLNELLRQARLCLRRGDLNRAAVYFDRAHDVNPATPCGAIGMALVATLLNRFADAAAILDRVDAKFPEIPESGACRRFLTRRMQTV